MSDSREQLVQPVRPEDAIDRGSNGKSSSVVGLRASAIRLGGGRSAAQRDDPRAERGGEARHGPPERAVAHDPDRQLAELAALQRLPRPLALQLQELRQVPADRQDHEQDVLRDRAREHAAGVGHEHVAGERGGRQGALDAGRRRVDPGQVRRTGKQAIERLGDEPAAEQDLDVVDRAVGEPLDREVDDARAGRRGLDPLEVPRRAPGRRGSG